MSTSVDLNEAERILNGAWTEATEKTASMPPAMKAGIDGVMSARDITFKYILVTGYLAKVTNPKIHARALQTASSLRQSYDARSVCHKVVVPFERSKGNLFGLSNEPFVNKPARHAEHDQDNSQLRNKVGSKNLHVALESAQRATADQVFAGLIYILNRGKEQSASDRQAEIFRAVSMPQVQKFCQEFLEETDGGARLVAVWGALTSLLARDADIAVTSPNSADLYAKTSGDIEVSYDKSVVSASECKQRPINVEDITHGLRKAAKNRIPEYLFVISAGIAVGQEKDVLKTITHGAQSIDTALVNIHEELPWLVRSLNPKRRGEFGETVVTLCRKMRKFDSARTAADLWNLLTH